MTDLEVKPMAEYEAVADENSGRCIRGHRWD